MVISDKIAWIYAIDASGAWGKQHEFCCFPEYPPKISSDGNTVICLHNIGRQIDIWTRRYSDQWIKQEIAIFATQAEFSPDGSLVALASASNLILLGLTEEGQWQEKGRQKFDYCRVNGFSFSPCGRSIRVDFEYVEEEVVIVSFWKIVPQE